MTSPFSQLFYFVNPESFIMGNSNSVEKIREWKKICKVYLGALHEIIVKICEQYHPSDVEIWYMRAQFEEINSAVELEQWDKIFSKLLEMEPSVSFITRVGHDLWISAASENFLKMYTKVLTLLKTYEREILDPLIAHPDCSHCKHRQTNSIAKAYIQENREKKIQYILQTIRHELLEIPDPVLKELDCSNMSEQKIKIFLARFNREKKKDCLEQKIPYPTLLGLPAIEEKINSCLDSEPQPSTSASPTIIPLKSEPIKWTENLVLCGNDSIAATSNDRAIAELLSEEESEVPYEDDFHYSDEEFVYDSDGNAKNY